MGTDYESSGDSPQGPAVASSEATEHQPHIRVGAQIGFNCANDDDGGRSSYDRTTLGYQRRSFLRGSFESLHPEVCSRLGPQIGLNLADGENGGPAAAGGRQIFHTALPLRRTSDQHRVSTEQEGQLDVRVPIIARRVEGRATTLQQQHTPRSNRITRAAHGSAAELGQTIPGVAGAGNVGFSAARPAQSSTIRCPYANCSFQYEHDDPQAMVQHLATRHVVQRCLWCDEVLSMNSTDDAVKQHLRKHHRQELLQAFGLRNSMACSVGSENYLMVPLKKSAQFTDIQDHSDEEDDSSDQSDVDGTAVEEAAHQLQSPPNSRQPTNSAAQTPRPASSSGAGQPDRDFVSEGDMYCSRCLRKAPKENDRSANRSRLGRDVELRYHTDPKRSCRIPNKAGDPDNLPNRTGWVRAQDLQQGIGKIKEDFIAENPLYLPTIYPHNIRSTLWKYDPNNEDFKRFWGLAWPPESDSDDQPSPSPVASQSADKRRAKRKPRKAGVNDAVYAHESTDEDDDQSLPDYEELVEQDNVSLVHASPSRIVAPAAAAIPKRNADALSQATKPRKRPIDPTFRPRREVDMDDDNEDELNAELPEDVVRLQKRKRPHGATFRLTGAQDEEPDDLEDDMEIQPKRRKQDAVAPLSQAPSALTTMPPNKPAPSRGKKGNWSRRLTRGF